MDIVHIVSPILVGGIIGYFTNYIAIKMLFRPRKAIFLGSWKLPFTPGVIPKNQKRLARAVGNAVSEQLITKKDLLDKLAGEEIKHVFVCSVADLLVSEESSLNGKTLRDSVGDETVGGVTDAVTDIIIEELSRADFLPVIREVGNHALSDYLRNPMIAMFLNESMVEGIYGRMNHSIRAYVDERGREVLSAVIEKKCSEMMDQSICEILNVFHISGELLTELFGTLFDNCMETCAESLIDQMDLREIVIGKIEEMPVDDLEALVMSVMKQELNTVVNLGAVIGAVIGMINILL